MTTVELQSLKQTPIGRTISYAFSHLGNGSYALLPDNKTGKTKVLKLTKSAGTDFYKYRETINFPFKRIKESNLLPSHSVELNASPIGSESQEYEDALVFNV